MTGSGPFRYAVAWKASERAVQVNIMEKSLFCYDCYRYYGGAERSLLKRLLLPLPCELQFLRAFRKAQYYRGKKWSLPLYWYWELKKRRLSFKTHIQIPTVAKVGRGLYINHFGRVIINSAAVLGNNITIGTGVTVGQTNRGKKKGAPVIADNVWIGTNAVVVGNVNIGTDVMIAPNAFVNIDVPPHSIVVGNPAKIISREGATDGYIENIVEI